MLSADFLAKPQLWCSSSLSSSSSFSKLLSTGRVGASTDSWPSELKRTQSIIAMFGFVLFWTVTIGHPDPEHFPHASHLGNILSNILLSHAANSPGLPVGTPAAGASKRPQSYTLRLRSLASALGQGRA